MRTIVSTKGQIVLPAEIRQMDQVKRGQTFEIERLDRGDYRLRLVEETPNAGLVDWLLACPVKGFLDATEATKPAPEAKVVAWLSSHEPRLVLDPVVLGEAMPLKDSMIAATAQTHGFTVATRNFRDFKKSGVKGVNPFE